MTSYTSVKAVFEFVEPEIGDLVVNLDEVKVVDVNLPNHTPFQLEVGLKTGHEDGLRPEVIKHLQPYFRQRGTTTFTNFPSEDAPFVHPKNCYIEFEGTGSVEDRMTKWSRYNKTTAFELVNGTVFGLRDGWVQEPTAIETFADGRVRIYFLDDNNSMVPYREIPATYFTAADPLSTTQHHLRGGIMKMWDAYLMTPGSETLIDIVPEAPYLDPADRLAVSTTVRMTSPAIRDTRPYRYKRIIDSLYQFDTVNGNRSAFWYFMRMDDRQNWAWDDQVYNVSNDHAANIGWMQWPDLWWADGPYNLGYDWLVTAVRLWLETDSHLWWNMIERWARFALTTSINWNTNVADLTNGESLDPTAANFSGFGKFGGRQWYEKGNHQFGNEVGTGYWPSEYKQYAKGICLIRQLFPNAWWAQEGSDLFLERLKQDGLTNWGGSWGQRTPGWKMMNAAQAWETTQDDQFRLNAISEAHNFIDLCKLPENMEWESAYHGTDSKWHNTELGLPYEVQTSYANRGWFQTWMLAKVAIGLLTVAYKCNVSPTEFQLFLSKASQIGSFLAEECTADSGYLVLDVGGQHPSRQKCFYLTHTAPVNIPHKVEGGMSWTQIPIGLAAIRGNPAAQALFPKMIKDIPTFYDLPKNDAMTLKFWENTCILIDLGDGTFELTHDGTPSTGNLDTGNLGHHIVLTSPSNKVTWHRIVSKSGNNKLIITDALKKSNRSNPHLTPQDLDAGRSIVGDALDMPYDFGATGHMIEDCNNAQDLAVRACIPKPVNRNQYENRPVDWAAGAHFNSWWKNLGFIVYNWDLPFEMDVLLKATQGDLM